MVTDDRQARRRCEEIGLNVKGTLGLMKLAVKHKILDKNKAIKLIRRVQSTSLYITRDLIEKAIEQIKRNT